MMPRYLTMAALVAVGAAFSNCLPARAEFGADGKYLPLGNARLLEGLTGKTQIVRPAGFAGGGMPALPFAILSKEWAGESGIVVDPSFRMVGPGVAAARPGELTWQVALILAGIPEPTRRLHCGGVLIDATTVVTAAHCVDNDTLPEQIDIVEGTTRFILGGRRIGVAKISIHPDWNPESKDNDIALLKLKSRARSAPIALTADPAVLRPGARVLVSGWGATSDSGDISIDLLKAEVPIVDVAVCNRRESYNGKIGQGMFCAGDGSTDACHGDSGGPAAFIVSAASKTLVGLVSWGEGCGQPLKYGVYTRVDRYLDWIAANR